MHSSGTLNMQPAGSSDNNEIKQQYVVVHKDQAEFLKIAVRAVIIGTC